MENKVFLIKTDTNWADEIDMEGFILCTEDAWSKYKEEVTEYNGYIELYFGTNEYNVYSNGKEYLSDVFCQPLEVDTSAVDVLKKLLNLNYISKNLITDLEEQKRFTFGQHCLLSQHDLEE
jgi:hypothetical protein